MAFERDWEEFFGKLDGGAPLTSEEEKHARAVRALRASRAAVPKADPKFLDALSSSLREEYVRSYGAGFAPIARPRFGLSALWRPFALAGAACAALVPAYLLLPREADAVSVSAVVLAGFLALAAAAYAALGTLSAALALWRARGCGAASPQHFLGAFAFVAGALVACAGLGVAYGAADSLGAELSFGTDFLSRSGLFEPAVFAAAFAVSAFALVSASASAARDGARSFPALAAAAAAAPWLPTVCIFLLTAHPSSALANGSFLALSALAMAASVWPFSGSVGSVDRVFAAASVLAASFPAYAYFLLPRDATRAEIAVCCTAVVAWAAVTAFSAVRRRGLPSRSVSATM